MDIFSFQILLVQMIQLGKSANLHSCLWKTYYHLKTIVVKVLNFFKVFIINFYVHILVSDPISELNTSQKQLKQLNAMLNEAEKNCSRYEQQNKFLKEDIRRLQRSVDRHAEIQNMEYLKNIIIKVCF